MKKIFIVTIAIFALVSCKSTQSVGKGEQSSQEKVSVEQQFVEENKWELISFNGQSPKDVGFVRTIPALIINMAENKIGGNAGCNSFGGAVMVEGNTISFDKIFSTKMYCEGVPEHEFFQMLEQPLQFEIDNNVLKLEQEGKILLEFKKTANVK